MLCNTTDWGRGSFVIADHMVQVALSRCLFLEQAYSAQVYLGIKLETQDHKKLPLKQQICLQYLPGK